MCHSGRLTSPEAGEPVGEDEDAYGELDEGDDGEGDGDLVLPARDNPRGSDDAHQLEDSEHPHEAEHVGVDLIEERD